MAKPSGDVTMDVGEWLRSLELGQYEAAFRDNGVDADVLPDLSDADLEKLGVLLGHRRRLLKAIANPAAPPPLVAPNAQPAPPPVESAERRHLTVMFCDLVGSTSISAKLDAEDWRDLVGGYIDAASAAVTRMGGHVAKKLGDGITALFGYPLAQENDAERALRAALEIQRALAEINARNANSGRPKLEARIGVETGAVVVNSAGVVFGDAPNVAARVQAAAEPGSVWTTARVRRQVAGLFVAEDRGAHELKGVPGHGETYINHGARIYAPMIHDRLAELEAEQMSLDEALTSIDRAIELAARATSDTSTPCCTGSAVTSCSRPIPTTPHPPRTPTSPPSPSRKSRGRAASACKRR